MGRELQKRKRRSSTPKVRQPSSRLSKLRNPTGNDIVAKNWDKNQTATQNYRRLGLVSRLNAPTGGAEPDFASKDKKVAKAVDPFAILTVGSDTLVSEVRVERDENGKILHILDSRGRKKVNPLNDALNELDTDSEDEGRFQDDGETWGGIDVDTRTDVVKQLEEEANRPREKRPRNQSEREQEWLNRLVAKHGEDTKAMARDRKLNPMQQTDADIARRLRKLHGVA